MAEPDSLVLDILRAIRGDVSKIQSDIRTIRAEMVAMRRVTAGIMTLQDNDHDDIASLKDRVDRIERRLEIAD